MEGGVAARPAVVDRARNRKVDDDTQARVHMVYADLGAAEIRDGVTSPVRTVIDCARRLLFAEALAVADSALRAGDVTQEELRSAASRVRGRGARQCRRVADAADARAAKPFESVLRALVLEFPGLSVVPQVPVLAWG
jgi:hypothetical protein